MYVSHISVSWVWYINKNQPVNRILKKWKGSWLIREIWSFNRNDMDNALIHETSISDSALMYFLVIHSLLSVTRPPCFSIVIQHRKLVALRVFDWVYFCISDVLLWTPSYGRTKAGQPARTYMQQLCEDTGCNPEDLPEATNDWEEWRERASEASMLAARHNEDDDISAE